MPTNSVHMINVSLQSTWSVNSSSWIKKPNMSAKRAILGVAYGDGYIYAVGGWGDGYSARPDAERFNLLTETWEILSAQMNVGRHGHSAVWVGGMKRARGRNCVP
jgi:hypothetical protein